MSSDGLSNLALIAALLTAAVVAIAFALSSSGEPPTHDANQTGQNVHELPRIEEHVIGFFSFRIHLPDATIDYYWIAHDLAELFDTEYQSEAVQLLDDAIEASEPSLAADLDIDRESGMAFIHAMKPEAMARVALIVNRLASNERRSVSPQQSAHLTKLLREWKRPKTFAWEAGSVFAIPLRDGTFTHGQVLDDHATCALFDARAVEPSTDVAKVLRSTVLSVLHLGSDLLDDGTWRVLGAVPPTIDPASGPYGRRYSVGAISFGGGGTLSDLAEVYYGLQPWNTLYKEDYYDEKLMPGLKRPPTANVLTPEERKRVRDEQARKREQDAR